MFCEEGRLVFLRLPAEFLEELHAFGSQVAVRPLLAEGDVVGLHERLDISDQVVLGVTYGRVFRGHVEIGHAGVERVGTAGQLGNVHCRVGSIRLEVDQQCSEVRDSLEMFAIAAPSLEEVFIVLKRADELRPALGVEIHADFGFHPGEDVEVRVVNRKIAHCSGLQIFLGLIGVVLIVSLHLLVLLLLHLLLQGGHLSLLVSHQAKAVIDEFVLQVLCLAHTQHFAQLFCLGIDLLELGQHQQMEFHHFGVGQLLFQLLHAALQSLSSSNIGSAFGHSQSFSQRGHLQRQPFLPQLQFGLHFLRSLREDWLSLGWVVVGEVGQLKVLLDFVFQQSQSPQRNVELFKVVKQQCGQGLMGGCIFPLVAAVFVQLAQQMGHSFLAGSLPIHVPPPPREEVPHIAQQQLRLAEEGLSPFDGERALGWSVGFFGGVLGGRGGQFPLLKYADAMGNHNNQLNTREQTQSYQERKDEGRKASKMSDFGSYAADWRSQRGMGVVVVGAGVGLGESVGLAEDHTASATHSQQPQPARAGVTLVLVLLWGFRLREMRG